MYLYGYHGTDATRAQSILAKNFQSSVRAGLWLGDGIYFFQDAQEHANDWAKFISDRRKDRPAVIKAKLAASRMIDLTDAHYWDLLRELYVSEVKDASESSQLGMRFLFATESEYDTRLLGRNFVDHRLMNVFIRYLIAYAEQNGHQTPQLVRAAFVEGKPIHPDSWLFDKASVIVSVFDPKVIIEPRLLS